MTLAAAQKRMNAYGMVTDILRSDCAAQPVPSGLASLSSTRSMTSSTAAQTDRALRCNGCELRNASDELVTLRGINLGGWLVTENWMCGLSDSINEQRFARETLESRFGSEAQVLMQTWESQWITALDVSKIQKLGFNMVRVPFSWRTLQHADGSWIRDAAGNMDFSRLDWIVHQARVHHLYVILDLHIWDSQQKDYQLISRCVDEAKPSQAHAAALWYTLASHFKGNNTIAGFDVVNEPNGSPANVLHHALYEAVRAGDPDRIVIMESVSWDDCWKNVMYSMHEYACMSEDLLANKDRWEKQEKPLLCTQLNRGAPLYVGEFMTNKKESWQWLLAQFNNMGLSWSPWTYKTVNMGGWGLYNVKKFRVDLSHDSFETILSVFSSRLCTMNNVSANKLQISAISQAASETCQDNT